jgi:hypothetical protein
MAFLAPSTVFSAASIIFNGSVTNQVIDGFGANINHRSWNNDDLKPVIDALVDQAGMTLFRVVYDKTDWEATNDNSDPNVMNFNYYNQVYSSVEFQKLWGLMGYLNQKGISNGLMPNFQGNGPAWLGSPALSTGMEAEWAEMIGSFLVYAALSNHLSFSLVGPDNELDQTVQSVNMTATQYTNALHKLAQFLDTNGLGNLQFVGPDLSLGNTSYMPQMMGDSVVMSKLAHFGLHNYYGQLNADVAGYIESSPYPQSTFWMTEFNVWCGQCDAGVGGTNTWSYASAAVDYLCNYLSAGASAGIVWEGYDSQYNYYNPLQWSYWGLFAVNDIHATTKTYTPRKIFYTLSQVSKWVRPGAQMIAVSGNTSGFSQLLAFKHPKFGQITIVGINTSGNATTLNGTLTGLPLVPRLELFYTSPTTNLADAGPVLVTNGTFNVSIPSNCVFTLTGAQGAWSSITNPSPGAQLSAPALIPIIVDAGTTTGSVAKVEFFTGATKLGESTSVPYQFTWTNVPMGDYFLTAVATDTVGTHGTSAPVNVSVVGPLAQILVSPSNALILPGNSQQFSATAFDLLGHALNPQPSFSWSNCCGGTIDNTGRFTAGPFIGGLLTVMAGNGGVSGAATVTIFSASNTSTFGNTNNGTFTDSLSGGGSWINAGRFQARATATAVSIRAKVTAITGNYKCAVYTDSGGTPRNFLMGSQTISNATNGWNTFPLTSSLTLTNGQYYWLAVWSDSSTASAYYSDSTGSSRWGKYTFGAWPNPITTTDSNNFNYCIFAQSSGGAPPLVTWSTPLPITYPTQLGAAQLNATSSVPGSFTYYPPSGSVLKAGLGQMLIVCFSPQDTNSYAGWISNKTIDVLQAPLLITAASTNKVFGAPLPPFAVSYNGFVNGETSAVLDNPPHVSTPAVQTSDAGTYLLTPTGAVARNYAIQYQSGTLTVAPANSTGSLSSSANPILPSTSVSFSYILSAVPPGAGTPTGAVDFLVDGVTLGTGVPLDQGSATFTPATLPAGRHVVQTDFRGSLNFVGTTNTLVPDLMVVPSPNLAIAALQSRDVVLRFAGLANETYEVEYTQTLDQPDWQSLGSCTADDSGLVAFTNSSPQGIASGFYRAVYR